MGYRLKYHNLKIMEYRPPSGAKNKYAVVEGNTLVSAVRGLSRTEAKNEIKKLEKIKVYVFTGLEKK